VGQDFEQINVTDERTARAEVAGRNARRDLRWSMWWAQPDGPDGMWRVIRTRRVAPDEAELPAEEFEEAVRAAVEAELLGPTRRARAGQTETERVPGTWAENVYSIRAIEIRLTGRCPATVLEVVYEPLASPRARFGMRFPMWPAEFQTVAMQAGQFTMYLGEASPGAHRKHGRPDDEITWVDGRGRER
jgi:hypothetical protein